MAKHRLKKQSALGSKARGAIAVGAVSAGAIGMVATPAAADTISVQGVGSFEVPAGIDVPDVPQPASMLPQLPAGFELPQIDIVRGSSDSAGSAGSAGSVDAVGQRAVAAAESKVGSPYVWGAAGPDAFDCSGLIQWAYQQAGVQLPRTSYDQAAAGYAVPVSDLQPGDIVLYNGDSHAAMYVGDGQIVHASTSGVPVKYASLNVMDISGARRI